MSKPRTKKKKDKAKRKAAPKPKAKPASNGAPERERIVHTTKALNEEARREAVALLERGDISVEQLAEDLGICEKTLRIWQREFAAQEENTPMTREERREMTRLRRENEKLRMERDILKKAATFFAKHRS